MAWLVDYSNLSDEQIRAVDASVSRHRFILGAPGSGKSLVLVHRAARLRSRLRVEPSRYRILVFTNALKDYIRSACQELGLEDECISTFDHWCREYHEEHLGRPPWDGQNRRPDFDATRRAVREHARGSGRKPLDFVLVDEGQDLDKSAFETLTAATRHVTVCADYKQQIYDHGASEPDIAAHLGLPSANVNLLSAFHCSPDLVPLAAEFVEDAEEKRLFVKQTRTWSSARELPFLYLAPDFDSERGRLAEIVRQRLLANERIAILLSNNRQVSGFAKGMREFGIEVEAQTANNRNAFDKLDFSSSKPKLMTYHSAKGLTFDSVLMPRLVENSFPNTSPAALRRLLFVGLTRAIKMGLPERCGGKASRTVGQPHGFRRIEQRGDPEGFDHHGCRGFHRERRSPAHGRRPDLTIRSPGAQEGGLSPATPSPIRMAGVERMRQTIERTYGYGLSRSADDLRPGYRFDETCPRTVPEAITYAMESASFEDALRNAVSLGGDSDTLAAIAGPVAEAMHGVPEELVAIARERFLGSAPDVIDAMERMYRASPGRREGPHWWSHSLPRRPRCTSSPAP